MMARIPATESQAGQFEIVPDEISLLAAKHQLGSFKRQYETVNPLTVIKIGFAIIIICVFVLLFFILIGFWKLGFYISFATAVLTIIIMIQALAHSGHKAYLYMNGFIYSEGLDPYVARKVGNPLSKQVVTTNKMGIASLQKRLERYTPSGTTSTAISYNQVQQVTRKINKYSLRHTYTFQCMNNRSVALSSYIMDINHLGETIETEAAKYLLPKALYSYNSGGTIPFGVFAVSQQGIVYVTNGAILPWNEVMNAGYVKNAQQGKIFHHKRSVQITRVNGTVWAKTFDVRIQNLEVFLQLINTIVASRQ